MHLATHGLLNTEHPELSGIVLSLVDEQGKPQDGFLRLHEVYNLNWPAELVVLSACRTGSIDRTPIKVPGLQSCRRHRPAAHSITFSSFDRFLH